MHLFHTVASISFSSAPFSVIVVHKYTKLFTLSKVVLLFIASVTIILFPFLYRVLLHVYLLISSFRIYLVRFLAYFMIYSRNCMSPKSLMILHQTRLAGYLSLSKNYFIELIFIICICCLNSIPHFSFLKYF